VCVAVGSLRAPVPAEVSPQSKLYVAIGVESVSVDADASAETCSGAVPLSGDTLNAAFGAASPVTVTVFVAVDDRPAVSVTVTVAV
jgi:hypothetical protein